VRLFAFASSARAQTAVGSFNPGADGGIYAVAVQPDGKILVGGAFTMLAAAAPARRRVAISEG